MPMDAFFTKTKCDRCGGTLDIRTLSWFTEETICGDCQLKERDLKLKLRKAGKGDMEGCGYVPKLEDV